MDVEVEVDIDSYVGGFKRGVTVSLGFAGRMEAVPVLTLIFLKQRPCTTSITFCSKNDRNYTTCCYPIRSTWAPTCCKSAA